MRQTQNTVKIIKGDIGSTIPCIEFIQAAIHGIGPGKYSSFNGVDISTWRQ
jgi:hypothetical protein